MTDDPLLSASLLRGLADSEIEVVSWGADTGELVLRVTKDIGPEAGLLRFSDVVHVNLAPRFTVDGMEDGSVGVLPSGYLATYGHDREMDGSERVFLFRESWGAAYFVVAASASYEILAARSASGDP